MKKGKQDVAEASELPPERTSNNSRSSVVGSRSRRSLKYSVSEPEAKRIDSLIQVLEDDPEDVVAPLRDVGGQEEANREDADDDVSFEFHYLSTKIYIPLIKVVEETPSTDSDDAVEEEPMEIPADPGDIVAAVDGLPQEEDEEEEEEVASPESPRVSSALSRSSKKSLQTPSSPSGTYRYPNVKNSTVLADGAPFSGVPLSMSPIPSASGGRDAPLLTIQTTPSTPPRSSRKPPRAVSQSPMFMSVMQKALVKTGQEAKQSSVAAPSTAPGETTQEPRKSVAPVASTTGRGERQSVALAASEADKVAKIFASTTSQAGQERRTSTVSATASIASSNTNVEERRSAAPNVTGAAGSKKGEDTRKSFAPVAATPLASSTGLEERQSTKPNITGPSAPKKGQNERQSIATTPVASKSSLDNRRSTTVISSRTLGVSMVQNPSAVKGTSRGNPAKGKSFAMPVDAVTDAPTDSEWEDDDEQDEKESKISAESIIKVAFEVIRSSLTRCIISHFLFLNIT